MKQALIRLTALVILAINQLLITIGWSPLPFSEEQVYEFVSSVALIVTAIYTWWKNNNVSKDAEQAQEYLNELKGRK